METEGGMTVYTVTEMEALTSRAKDRAVDYYKDGLRESLLGIFKDEVRHGNMTREYATDLFNSIASANGLDTVDSINSTYTVFVTYFNEEVLEVPNVEANDEDDACEIVSNEIEVTDAKTVFHIRYGGDWNNAEVDYDAYDVVNSLEYRAEESE